MRNTPLALARGLLTDGVAGASMAAVVVQQVTILTKPQTDVLAKLGIPAPKQIITLELTPR